MDWRLIATVLVVGADWMFRALRSVRVVMRRREVSASLAWLAIIFFVPFVGGFVYLLVGESRLGTRRVARYHRISASFAEQAVSLWKQRRDWGGGAERFEQIARLGTVQTGLPPFGGNRVQLFGQSGRFIEALCADIDQARHHCHVLTYIWQVGGEPDRVVEALSRAAERGVECRVLVDSYGGNDFLKDRRVEALRRSGAQVVEALHANPLRMLLQRIDLRNHRKLAIIDGRVAYAGSQNMTDDGFRVSRRAHVGPWIDATARVEGLAAQALGLVFLRDWQLDSGEDLDVATYLPELERPEGGAEVQALPSGPGEASSAIRRAALEMIHAAREELILTTPYFVPDEPLKLALESAAMRGVEVWVVVPRELDAPIVQLASQSHFLDLMRAGVRIFRHSPGLLHAKTITVDREFGVIGSANFDTRSFHLNFEVTLLIYDTDVASELRLLQREYMSSSEEIDAQAWGERPVLKRFLENVARLGGPLV
ncbi:MAG: cardiolipin synthase [Phycisphaerales bacterium JB059]